MRRTVLGAVAALAGVGVLSAGMVPVRSHLSVATAALVLVVPVVLGVVLGGFPAGVAALAAGFLAYDLLFIPPYGTLRVGSAQNWVALAVYVVVVSMVARVVSSQQRARVESARREADARRLYELSDALVGDRPLAELLQRVATALKEQLSLRSVSLLLADGESLSPAAAAGEPLSEIELAQVLPSGGRARSAALGGGSVVALPLSAAGRPFGLVVLVAPGRLEPGEWAPLRTYVNQLALALERARLRDQAVRNELLEEADRMRSALLGAVSHDLRTPLASLKAAVSDLRQPGLALSEPDAKELLGLVEGQADRLARMITNLLDMTRIEAGALERHLEVTSVEDLVAESLALLGRSEAADRIVSEVPSGLPPVEVDHVLIGHALVNLLENAERHAPRGTKVIVGARARAGAAGGGASVEIWVEDHGPGVPAEERERIFTMFTREGPGGRSGLGLAIAKAFVEAHGGTIRVEEASGGGARFALGLPAAPALPEVG